jgi:hypothetical protein
MKKTRSKKSRDTVPLKVLSSKMDPTDIRLIRLVFIKERGAEGF